MPARVRNNTLINVNDRVTCLGNVVSVSGPLGSQALVTIQPLQSVGPDSTFVALGSDSAAVETDAGAPALSKFGKSYGYVGDQTSTSGTVTAITGSGASATLTVTLNSGLSVLVPANSCNGVDFVGGN